MVSTPDIHAGDEKGKLFVGGLSWETTRASMLKYFSRYGEVIDCVVMKNQQTGKSRGFGFVKYRDPSCVETVLANGPHILDGRQIDPKACNPRSMNQGGKNAEKHKNKVFLGGLPLNITETEIREVFGQYGTVVDVVIMFDQQKQKSRGFGFLSYESEESVDRVCQQHYVQIGDKKVEVKKAEPRDNKLMIGHSPSALAFTAGLMQANGALGMPGLAFQGAGLAGATPAAVAGGYPHHALQQGVSGAGYGGTVGTGLGMAGSSSLGGLPQAAVTADGESTGTLAPQTPVSASYYLPAGLRSSTPVMSGAAAYASGYSATAAGTPLAALDTYSAQAQEKALTSQVSGLFGSYSQDASSYGPARAHSISAQSPFTGGVSVTYAASPALAHLQGGYASALGAGYGGVALPLAYGGHGDAPQPAYTATALPARSLSATQGFHPYRRLDDAR